MLHTVMRCGFLHPIRIHLAAIGAAFMPSSTAAPNITVRA